MKNIIRTKDGFDFEKELKKARQCSTYYEEGLLIDIADRIIDAMESKGVSRSELARRLDVSPSYITKILRGHANLSLESLARLAFALDLKWECILIAKESEIRQLVVSNGQQRFICTVETATVEWQKDNTESKNNRYLANEYQKGISYEVPMSIPA